MTTPSKLCLWHSSRRPSNSLLCRDCTYIQGHHDLYTLIKALRIPPQQRRNILDRIEPEPRQGNRLHSHTVCLNLTCANFLDQSHLTVPCSAALLPSSTIPIWKLTSHKYHILVWSFNFPPSPYLMFSLPRPSSLSSFERKRESLPRQWAKKSHDSYNRDLQRVFTCQIHILLRA